MNENLIPSDQQKMKVNESKGKDAGYDDLLGLDSRKAEEMSEVDKIKASKKKRIIGLVIGAIIVVIVIVIIVLLVVLKKKGSSDNGNDDYKNNPFSATKVEFLSDLKIAMDLSLDTEVEYGASNNGVSDNSGVIDAEPDEPYYTNIDMLNTTVTAVDDHRINIKIVDQKNERWEVPNYTEDDDLTTNSHQHFHINETFQFETQPFSFSIKQHCLNLTQDILATKTAKKRNLGEEKLTLAEQEGAVLTTKHSKFAYSDKYIEFQVYLQSNTTFGLGERASTFSLKYGTYTIFNRDQGTPIDEGIYPGAKSMYGTHPFVLNQLKNGNFIGLFLRNSNAQEIILGEDENGPFIKWRVIGGIIDLTILSEGPADFIVKKYHALIGRSYLPPFWILGFIQSRWGYRNQTLLENVLANYEKHDLPLETLVSDIDYMYAKENFIVNTTAFPNMSNWVEKNLHDKNMRYLCIVDTGMKVDENYQFYVDGKKKGVFIKSANTSDFLVGEVWPGLSTYPDFFHPNCSAWWQSGIEYLHKNNSFDGLWFDMNEYASFCDGECPKEGSTSNSKLRKPFNTNHDPDEFSHLNYTPGNHSLIDHTISMTGYHYSNTTTEDLLRKEYNTHSLNGFLLVKASFEYFKNKPTRPFMFTRSTFAGSGKYSSHWLGDNFSNFKQLEVSIPGVLNSQLFGFPVVGADICGFNDNSTKQLCLRWMQAGAFYPFSRNHNSESSTDQEPYAFDEEVIIASRNALRQRYSILRFLYTKLFEVHLYGGTIVTPLYFEFPYDVISLSATESQLLLGKDILVTPCLTNDSSYSIYLPNANWYDLQTLEKVLDYSNTTSQGIMIDFATVPIEYVPWYLRGGSIIPFQDAEGQKVRKTKELEELDVTLLIGLDENNKAKGTMVADDGISQNTTSTKSYRHYDFIFKDRVLKINLIEGFDYTASAAQYEQFSTVKILGAQNLENITQGVALLYNMGRRPVTLAYDKTKLILTMTMKPPMPLSMIESIMLCEADDYCLYNSYYYLTDARVFHNLTKMNGTLTSGGKDATQYLLEGQLLNDDILNVKISPTERKAWEVPYAIEESTRNSTNGTNVFQDFAFNVMESPNKFYFSISESSGPSSAFLNTSVVYMNETMLELTVLAWATEIYGLGERVGNYTLGPGTYTVFAKDQMSPVENGKAPGKNMYSSQPFYMIKTLDGQFAGVMFLTSNAMDLMVKQLGKTILQIDHIISGGLLDIFFIKKNPDPNNIIKQYQNIVGRPTLVPYWSFGHHQCRFGYHSQEKLQEVVDNYTSNHLPLDGIWADMDYMDHYRAFTVNKEKFPNMKEFSSNLQGRHFVPIVNPGITINQTFTPFKNGLDQDVFIKSASGDITVGLDWTGYCTYVDFEHPNAQDYWVSMLQKLRDETGFSGIWLDKNEVHNQCYGDCGDEINLHEYLETYPSTNLPYIPGHVDLQDGAIDLTALHYDEKGVNPLKTEFNYHSIYGLMQTKATNLYFTETLKQRPFIITRSTFPGSGRYAGHWLGDNFSNWDFLGYSIIGIFNFQMFGINQVGPDICGFSGDASDELCQRWYQLATFYPFSRNHNDEKSTAQEPYRSEALKKTAQKALSLRYSLLRYLYTEYMKTTMEGGMFFKPLFFDFYNDPLAEDSTLVNYIKTFLCGSSLKVSPVLEEKVSTISSYFPNQNWYTLSGEVIMNYTAGEVSGKSIDLKVDLADNNIQVHLRGGYIIPQQDMDTLLQSDLPVSAINLTTEHISLLIGPDQNNKAEGFLFYDDGEDILTLQKKSYHYYDVQYDDTKITFAQMINTTWKAPDTFKNEIMTSIKVFNAERFKNIDHACATVGKELIKLSATYENQVLTIDGGENGLSLIDLSLIDWSTTASC